MNTAELYFATDDISDSLLGVHRQVRTRYVKHKGWVAYVVNTGSMGGIESVRVMKTTNGKSIRSWEGKGDLIEKINAYAGKGMIP